MTKQLEEIQYEFNQASHQDDPCELFLQSLDSETFAVGERRVKEVWE
jgi:hypothetical protein|tara:strand:+ start:200 stop:340 length:141 start_codon:yes stop_codon:yes gene_type:complete